MTKPFLDTWLTALGTWTRHRGPAYPNLSHIAAMMIIALEGSQ